jgi:hypothetical protein
MNIRDDGDIFRSKARLPNSLRGDYRPRVLDGKK